MARRAGFTLAEVMVAIVLLSIAVLGLVGVQAYAVRSTEGNRQRHMASEIAASVMSGLESGLKEKFVVEPQYAVDPPSRVPHTPGFEVAVRQLYENPPANTLIRVHVDVFYSDEHGPHSYPLWCVFRDPQGSDGR